MSLMIPVNLRNFFPSESMTNFWSWIETAQTLGENASFADVVGRMKEAFGKDSLREEVSCRMNDLGRLEKNPFLRAVPLEIKNLFLMAGTTLGGRSVTAVYSNIGRIRMPEGYEGYIERFGFFASTDKLQLCSCSYGEELLLGLTSKIPDDSIQRNFLRILEKEEIPCREERNDFPGCGSEYSQESRKRVQVFTFLCVAVAVICGMIN